MKRVWVILFSRPPVYGMEIVAVLPGNLTADEVRMIANDDLEWHGAELWTVGAEGSMLVRIGKAA